jgi:predicted amidohydrolase YtcJ
MLEIGVPVGAGTDATRVSSYNPYLSLYWLITGKTIGGLELYPEENRLDREEALKLYTMGSSWFSTEDGKKGALAPGQLADLAVLSADYFSIADEEIKQLESVLTIVGGKVVYARRILETRTAGFTGEPRLVSCQRVRWLCKGAARGRWCLPLRFLFAC